MNRKHTAAIAAIVVITAVLTGAILLYEGDHADHADGPGVHQEHAAHQDAEHHGEDKGEGNAHDDDQRHADVEHHAATQAGARNEKGPHGGTLYHQGETALEVLLSESDGSLLVYPYAGGKPVPPAQALLAASITRPGQPAEALAFGIEQDAWRANAPIAEPHLFDIRFQATVAQVAHDFGFARAEGRIALDRKQMALAGIEVKRAGAWQMNSSLQLPGEIRLNADRTAHVVPQVAGVVESVAANLGQKVKKGQVLAVINSSAVSEQRAALLNAQQRLALASSTYAREKALWEQKISAEQDYQQAQTALQEAQVAVRNASHKLQAIGADAGAGKAASGLSRYELRAPFDGVVIEKHLGLGEAVKEDANAFLVSDLSTVWAEIIVSPKDLAVVRTGEQALVRATAFNASARGRISYVGSLIGEQTRTAKAHVVLPNPDDSWRPGLFVTVDVMSDQAQVPVAVAADALQTVDGKSMVFVRVPGGFAPREVSTGRSDGKFVEIRAGLAADTEYAATGSFAIKAELGKGSAEHSH